MRRGWSGLTCLAIAAIAITSANAQAAVNHDLQSWTLVFAQKRFAEHWGAYLELQPRVGQDLSDLEFVLIRPAAVYYFNPDRTLWLGYLLNRWFQASPDNEHRVWTQFQETRKSESHSWVSRTRLEYRDLPTTEDSSWRFRQMIRGLLPVSEDKSWSAVAWDEIFFSLNSVAGGPVSGFDQNRLFVGINKKLGAVSVEPGYLMNFVDRPPGSDNRMNHAFYLMINWVD